MPILRRAGAATIAAGTDHRTGALSGSGMLARRSGAPVNAWFLPPIPQMRGALAQCLDVARQMAAELRDPYRPELHYMRGPGPRWRAKHGGARSGPGH